MMKTTETPPPGIEALLPAFDRTTRIARALFGDVESLIILMDGERVWRSRGPSGLPNRAMASEEIISTGKPLWVGDTHKEPRFIFSPKVTDNLGIRFYAGAPINLSDGTTMGALSVVGLTPRPHDPKLLARLCDLAASVAADCERARATAKAKVADDVLSAFVETIPLGVVMTDREMRVLTASPAWLQAYGLMLEQAIGRTLYEISEGFSTLAPIHQRCLAGERISHPRWRWDHDGVVDWLETELMPWRDTSGDIGGILVTAHNVTDRVEAMERTERSERRLKLALDLADLHVWEMDVETGRLEMAGQTEQFFDHPITYDEMRADPFVSLHPDDKALARDRVARRTAGEVFDAPFECRTNRHDGKEVWCSVTYEVVRDPHGDNHRLIGVMQNITRRKASETALKAALDAATTAQQVLAAFVESIPISVVMTDREFNLVKASPRWKTFFGYSDIEVEGQSVFDLVAGDYEQFREALEDCLAGNRRTNPRVKFERDGQVDWLQTELIPWRNHDGEIGGILISAHNITEMVEALDRTERSEQRLQMAVQLADLHVWEIDYARGVLEKVGAADTFFDKPLSYEDVRDDPLFAVHPADREMARESLRRRMDGATQEPLVCRMNRTDGREVWAASAAEVILGADGKPERMVGLFQNVTSMKLAERSLIEARDAAEAANRSKSEFLANMSHEIRTPLNGVLGMTQVIEADELSDVQRERVRVVRESGGALLAILNDVLDLSKIQAGKLELNPADFDIEGLAPVVAAAFEGSAAAKDIGLTVKIEDSARGLWVGDILRLRQVLSNLVSNALKFTSEGAVSLTVSHDDRGLVMAVRDTGIGIETSKIASLFEKFSQEDASTTRRYGGTGLGLSICRELVELMNGSIEVESVKGQGSCFSVILPLERSAEGVRLAAGPVERPAGAQTLAAIRVLAAEDNPTNQLVLRSLLQPLGVEMTIAGNGREAVEAFGAAVFDLILMDVQMPEMNGVEATQAIRAIEATQGRVRTPILALSANVMTHQIADYLACGMDGCVAKPIEVEKLYVAMETALDEAEPAKESHVA